MPRYPRGLRLTLLAGVIPVCLGGCAVSPSAAPVAVARPEAPASDQEVRDVKRALYGELNRWRGTRYLLGGMGQKGIDCSGLAYVVYRDVFGMVLPRTTEGQESVGDSVGRNDLEAGDLVFFKTGIFKRHVGIYIDNGLFMHASVSDGVRLSSLKNRYWRRHYWQARRIDPT